MKKLLIPAILTATILVAGMFSFIPIQKASTVHNTVINSTIGLACVTDSVTVSGAINTDQVIMTFTLPIVILGIRVAITTGGAGDTLGFAADPTVNAAIMQTTAVAEAIDDTPFVEIISQMAPSFLLTIRPGGSLVLTFVDADGTAVDVNDVISFRICGLVVGPANFNDAAVIITCSADCAE